MTEKLDDLKRALDDLKIVDVHRKPAGLSAELQAPLIAVLALALTRTP